MAGEIQLNSVTLATESGGTITLSSDVDTLTPVKTALNASGSAPIYACRAWVNFDGTFGTSPFTIANGGIRASGNVSSITDNGTGDYTVNFTTAMPDADYCVTTAINQPDNTSARGNLFGPQFTGAYSTSSVRVISKLSAVTSGYFDYEFLNVAIFR